jgi:hypothetical protein
MKKKTSQQLLLSKSTLVNLSATRNNIRGGAAPTWGGNTCIDTCQSGCLNTCNQLTCENDCTIVVGNDTLLVSCGGSCYPECDVYTRRCGPTPTKLD